MPTRALAASPVVITLLAGAALGLGGCQITKEDLSPPSPGQITGRYVAVICDADMGAEGFYDGNLHRPREGAVDMLSIIGLPIRPAPSMGAGSWQTDYAQIAVSNSVMGPPVGLAISPDGTQAFVVETHRPAPIGAQRVSDLPAGDRVTSIDVSDPMNPRDPMHVEVGTMPMSVDVHPLGDVLAVTTRRPGQQLVLVPVANRVMGQARGWSLLGIDDKNALASSVQWSPSGRYLAITLPERNQVVFYEYSRTAHNGQGGLAPWGQPVQTGPYPHHGQWTADGRHFVVSEMHWAGGFDGVLASTGQGSLSVIRVSDVPTAVQPDGSIDSTMAHTVVSRAAVGISPGGLAISPDDRWVVTSNMRHSGSYGGTSMVQGGSVSLLSLSAAGVLSQHGEYALDALPQGIAFDRDGRHVLVTQFQSLDPQAVDGEMTFFRLNTGGNGRAPKLIQGAEFIGVGVGPHGVIVVR